METITSWGGVESEPCETTTLQTSLAPFSVPRQATPVGALRSYGDLAVPASGSVAVVTSYADRTLSFETTADGRPVVCVEAGASLFAVARSASRLGLALPVVPGTSLVSVGGAIANDVHGKNQHAAGSFGNHVESLLLARSDGSVLNCSESSNPWMFRATIGGLGATGLILSARLFLRPDFGTVDCTTSRFSSIEGFFHDGPDNAGEFDVSWIDGYSKQGSGIRFCANPVSSPSDPAVSGSAGLSPHRFEVPATPPFSLFSGLAGRGLNASYRLLKPNGRSLQGSFGFLFPLDSVCSWNRLYGPAGFCQHQSLVPPEAAAEGLGALFRATKSFPGSESALCVLKSFGKQNTRALLSFAREGTSLAMDFPGSFAKNERLFRELDAITFDHGGILYPAKAPLMSRRAFEASFPQFKREVWAEQSDPAFLNSTFLRRVLS